MLFVDWDKDEGVWEPSEYPWLLSLLDRGLSLKDTDARTPALLPLNLPLPVMIPGTGMVRAVFASVTTLIPALGGTSVFISSGVLFLLWEDEDEDMSSLSVCNVTTAVRGGVLTFQLPPAKRLLLLLLGSISAERQSLQRHILQEK